MDYTLIATNATRSARWRDAGIRTASRSLTRWRVRSRAIGAVLAGVLLGLALCGCGGPDRAAYVKENERLFAQLPRYPGARLDGKTSSAARAEEDGPVVGYVTLFEFELPRQATSESVGSFYRQKLRPSWRLVETLDGPVFNFRRGRVCISINLESSRAHSLEIAVDHACS
jgi:hypothetical protein